MSDLNAFIQRIEKQVDNNKEIKEDEIIEEATKLNLDLDDVANALIEADLIKPLPEDLDEKGFVADLFRNI